MKLSQIPKGILFEQFAQKAAQSISQRTTPNRVQQIASNQAKRAALMKRGMAKPIGPAIDKTAKAAKYPGMAAIGRAGASKSPSKFQPPTPPGGVAKASKFAGARVAAKGAAKVAASPMKSAARSIGNKVQSWKNQLQGTESLEEFQLFEEVEDLDEGRIGDAIDDMADGDEKNLRQPARDYAASMVKKMKREGDPRYRSAKKGLYHSPGDIASRSMGKARRQNR